MMIERWFQRVLLRAAVGIEEGDDQKSRSYRSTKGITIFHGHQNHTGKQLSLLSRNVLLLVTSYPITVILLFMSLLIDADL